LRDALSADPFVEADATEARFTQRHERKLLDPADQVSKRQLRLFGF